MSTYGTLQPRTNEAEEWRSKYLDLQNQMITIQRERLNPTLQQDYGQIRANIMGYESQIKIINSKTFEVHFQHYV